MKNHMAVPITVDGDLKGVCKISFKEHVKHSINVYWYEVWIPREGGTLHTGVIEFDETKGEIALLAEVLTRVSKRKTDNKKEKGNGSE